MSPWTKVLAAACLLLSFSFASAQPDTTGHAEAQRLFVLCKSSFAKGEIDEAIRYGKKAVELDQTNFEYHLWLGIAYSEKTRSGFFLKKLSNARKCKKAFERAVELNPTSAATREGLLEFHVRAPGIAGGSMDEAKRQATEIAKIDQVRGHYASAYVCRHEEEYARVEQELMRAIELSPQQPQPYLHLGGFYVNQKEPAKALAAYLEGVENNPAEPRAYYELGWFYQTRQEHDKAAETFRKILQMDPDEVNACFFLAGSYLDGGQLERADEILSKILQVDSDYTGISFLQGKRALASGEGLKEGLEHIEKYLTTDPQEGYDPSWAYTHLLPGIESYAPSWAAAHFVAGKIYEGLGKRKKAKKEYEKALKLNPKLEMARQAREQLKRKRWR